MGNKKKQQFEEVEAIMERFKHLSTEQLIERKTLFGNPLRNVFKMAINRILKERGVKE